MLQEIIKTGGGSFLIFAVRFLIGLYAVRGVFGQHGRRGQHRKEFLEMWADGRTRDALWMQTAVRHVFGAWLPTPVIRLALARPDSGQSLVDLSELWSLLEFDSGSQQVRWRRAWHATRARRQAVRVAMQALYFVCAFAAVGGAYVSAYHGTGTVTGWIYGFFAAVMIGMAFLCLASDDTFAASVRAGDAWVNRINRAAKRPRKRQSRKPA